MKNMGKRKRSGSFSKTDDSGAKKSDECDSQEELDLDNGSLLTRGINNSATRCSARVQEKQEKLRREASPSKQILPPEIACPAVTTGNNSNKHPSPNGEDVAGCFSNDVGANLLTSVGLEEKRKKRNWELWSLEDKQLFFEALNEFGKDFDAIQNYLATKLKSRSKSVVCGQYAAKNKDQVRHFYYRTWNKISKHLNFPPDMKKASQELYGLVNYGELRKKQRVLNSKSAVKLCELVDNGITSIKFRGKTCRIKTPVCRALKRLNGLEDVEHTRVPHKLSIELTPQNRKTWRSVQSVSHNPRVKVFVSLQRTLASVITFFEEKWKRNNDRLKEQFSSVFGKPVSRLRVIPIDKRELSIPLYKVAENTSSTTICLRSFTENVLSREKTEETELANSKMKRKRKQSGGGAGGSSSNIDPNCNVIPSLSSKPLDTVDACLADAENSDVETQFTGHCASSAKTNKASQDPRFPDEQSNEIAWMRFQQKWLGEEEILEENARNSYHYPTDENANTDANNAATETDNDDLDHDLDDGMEKLCACGSVKPADSENFVSHVWDDEKIKLGWTAEEAGVMTIGEIYLMLGQTEKLAFEYCWDTRDVDPEDARSKNLLDRLITSARLLKKKKNSRSKTALLGSSTLVNSGSLVKCSNCGCKLEIQSQTPSKEGSISGANNNNNNNAVNVVNCSLQSQIRNRPQGYVVELLPNVVSSLQISATDLGNNAAFSPPMTSKTQISSNITINSINSEGFGQTELSDLSALSKEIDDESNIASIMLKEREYYKEKQQTDITSGESHFYRTVDIRKLESGTISPPNTNQSNCDQYINKCSPFPNSEVNQGSITGGLIELSSLATISGQDSAKKQGVSHNIKATLLPSSSSFVKNVNGSMTVQVIGTNNTVSIPSTVDNSILESVVGIEKKDPSTKVKKSKSKKAEKLQSSSVQPILIETAATEKRTFRKPVQIAMRPIEPKPSQTDKDNFPPPKPFVDLPKVNRRLGRRPNFKRVVIPRVLPLLPKLDSNTIHLHPLIVIPPEYENLRAGSSSSTGRSITHTQSKLLKPSIGESGLDPELLKDTKKSSEKSYHELLSSSQASDLELYREAREIFLGAAHSSTAISCNSNDFEDLLKVRRQESNSNIQSADMDSLSLSSFMEISLPESARIAANDCINTDLHIEDMDNSNSSINLSSILGPVPPKLNSKDLTTPESSPKKLLRPLQSPAATSTDTSITFENPWQLEPGEMSLSNIFGNYDAARGDSSESELTFRSITDEDHRIDFDELAEMTARMENNSK